MASNTTRVDSFATAVGKALDRYSDAAWLGRHSPLAAPYFLGGILDLYQPGDTEEQRGNALRQALLDAAKHLPEESKTFTHRVFFAPPRRKANVKLAEEFNLSERTFYRMKKQTVQELAHVLSERLLPPLRPEVPLNDSIIDRSAHFKQCLTALQSRQTVYLYGQSGVGKTVLAASIFACWNQLAQPAPEGGPETSPWSDQVFSLWYTIRPGLNDYLSSFVFALAYFLRAHGFLHIWRQIVADGGKIDAERVLGMLRYDLDQSSGASFLICIDEVDLLQQEVMEHSKLIHLFEQLRGLMPVLLIGQRSVMQADEHIALHGFDKNEVAAYFRQHGIQDVSSSTLDNVMRQTYGNAGLIKLLVTLCGLGESISSGLQSLERAPSIEALFLRIWRKLSVPEKAVLMQLAVFRGPSPEDAWDQEKETLFQVLERGLVRRDAQGGIEVLSHIRRFIQEKTARETRPTLHIRAAVIRASRGEIVPAIHHFANGHEPQTAVNLWFMHKDVETERGNGAVALRTLSEIPDSALPKSEERKALHVGRAALHKLLGQPDEALDEIQAVGTIPDGAVGAYILQLHGEILEMQGEAYLAAEKYQSALDMLGTHPETREITLHTRLGFLREFSMQDRERAKQEAILARIKAEGFHGNIEEISGNYSAARERYEAALRISNELTEPHHGSLSRIYSQLGVLAVREGDFPIAIELIQKAIDHDRQRGDMVGPLFDMLNLAYAHAALGAYDLSLEVAQEGLDRAVKLRHSYLIAGLAAGVGEAYFGLEEYDNAEKHAHLSLAQEESFFRSPALTLLGMIRDVQRQYVEAERYLRAAISSAVEVGDQFCEANAFHMLGRSCAHAGSQEESIVALRKAREIYDNLQLAYKAAEIDLDLTKFQ